MKPVTNKPKCTGAIKKQLIRNINVTTTDTNRPRVHFHSSFNNSNNVIQTSEATAPLAKTQTATTNAGKYRTPELNTALTMSRKIDKIKAAPIPAVNKLDDLTPRSMAFVRNIVSNTKFPYPIFNTDLQYFILQAVQRLNTRTDRTGFHDLVPMNVNDSVLELNCPPLLRRKTFVPLDKDPEPVLTDYLEPIETLTHNVTMDEMYPDNIHGLAAYIRSPYTENHRDICTLFEELNYEY